MNSDRNNLRFCTIDGILATPWTLLMLPASFLMSALLTVYYGISPQMFGIIVSIPWWCNALQILAVPVISRFMTVRELTLSMSWLNLGLCAMLGLLVLILPKDEPHRLGWFFIGFYFLATASLSLSILGWQTWIKDIVPQRIRGTYFGQRNRLASLSSLLYLCLCMALLGLSGNALWAFQVLILIAVGMRAVSVLVQHLIRQPPNRDWTQNISSAWMKDIRDLVRNRMYMRFVIFGALFGFWNGAITAYVPVYVLGYLQFSPSQFAACAIIATITGALSLPTGGRMCDRFGSVRVAFAGLLMWRIGDFLWAVVTPEWNWMLYLMWALGGLSAAGFILAAFNVLLEITPRQQGIAGISLNLAVSSVAAALAPILGGWWITFGEAQAWSAPVIYRPLLVVSFIGCLASLPVLLRIDTGRQARPSLHVFGAMRTARQQMVSMGMAFLGNTSFASKQWRRSGRAGRGKK